METEILQALPLLRGEMELPMWVHHVAFFLFGLTGGLAAVKRHYDFVGLFAMAFATAAGGGLIRDGLFIQNGPAIITQNSYFIVVIAASALVAVLFRRSILRLTKIIAWIDALGLGVYTAFNLELTLQAGLSTASAIVVGIIGAAGGSLLRDLLAGEEPLMLKPGQFYILAALAGCGMYFLCLRVEWLHAYAAWCCVWTTVVIRILAIQFNWSTVSVARWDRSHGGEEGEP